MLSQVAPPSFDRTSRPSAPEGRLRQRLGLPCASAEYRTSGLLGSIVSGTEYSCENSIADGVQLAPPSALAYSARPLTTPWRDCDPPVAMYTRSGSDGLTTIVWTS